MCARACVRVRACVHVLQTAYYIQVLLAPVGMEGGMCTDCNCIQQSRVDDIDRTQYPSVSIAIPDEQSEKGSRKQKGTDHAMQCTTWSRNMPRSAGFPLSQIGAAHQFTVALAGFGVASASHACRRER